MVPNQSCKLTIMTKTGKQQDKKEKERFCTLLYPGLGLCKVSVPLYTPELAHATIFPQ